jgi:hypothetical protein
MVHEGDNGVPTACGVVGAPDEAGKVALIHSVSHW